MRLARMRRSIDPVVFGVLPVLFTAWLLAAFSASGNFAVDFHNAFWGAARAVLHGETPYVSPNDSGVAAGAAFVYPAPAVLLLAPFALFSNAVSCWVFTLLGIVAVPATLRVLGVTDWRMYGLALLWPPIMTSWQTANLTTLLGLGAAVAWRLRSRPAAVGVTVGLLIAVKLFLWPLVLWLLATRRYRATAWSFAAGVAVNVAAWSLVGWDELARYTDLMEALATAMQSKAYSLAALGTVGLVVELALAASLVVIGLRGDREAFTAAIAGALLLSPLIWSHYFALLLIPVALAYPRSHRAWALPLLMWAIMPPATDPAVWQLAAMLTVAGLTVALCARRLNGVRIARRQMA